MVQDEDDIPPPPPTGGEEAKPFIPDQAGPLPSKQDSDRYAAMPNGGLSSGQPLHQPIGGAPHVNFMF